MRAAFRRAPETYDERFVGAMAKAYLDQTPWTRLRLDAVRELVEADNTLVGLLGGIRRV